MRLSRLIEEGSIMKANHKFILFVLMTVALNTALLCSAFAGSSSASKSNEQMSKNVEMLDGVMSIKEGHGEFLIRLPDGKAQRFSVKTGAEITRNGQPARYSELKVSDSITVQYDGSTREVIAIHANGQ